MLCKTVQCPSHRVYRKMGFGQNNLSDGDAPKKTGTRSRQQQFYMCPMGKGGLTAPSLWPDVSLQQQPREGCSLSHGVSEAGSLKWTEGQHQ